MNQKIMPLKLKLYWMLWAAVVGMTAYVCHFLVDIDELPIRWGPDLYPYAFADKWVALMALPAASVLVALVLKFVPVLEPRRQHLMNSAVAYVAGFWATQMLLLLLQIYQLSYALGMGWSIATFLVPGIGLLFTVLGNYLGKIQSTFIFGINTPWTLSSETVWRKTHREAGYLFFGVGVLLILSTPWANMFTLLAAPLVAVIMVIWVFVRSYIFWRAEQRRKQDSAPVVES